MMKPKAILFDIGGVCVVSPFEAIVEYESKHGIPKDYINFAIARSAPNGAWQQLERGEIKMDDNFFEGFKRDLHNLKHWEQYHLYFKHSRGKSLKNLAGVKATQLGDPISLKAELSPNNPTPDEAGAPKHPRGARRSLKEVANRSMLGDPVSLKTETNESSPLPDDSGAPAERAPATGGQRPANTLQQSYQRNMLGDPTSLKNEGSKSDPIPDQQDTGYTKDGTDSTVNSGQMGNSLKESYSRNMLGDPTSLQNEKLETGEISASTSPDRNDSIQAPSGGNSLKESYSRNMLGDPTSLKNEGSSSNPVRKSDQATGYRKEDRVVTPLSLQSSYKRNPLGDPTSLKNEGSSSEPLPTDQDTGSFKSEGPSQSSIPGIPTLPKIDSTALFWDMMARGRTPDPHMFPALINLRQSNQYIVAALSNTVIFPEEHEYAKDSRRLYDQFDVFVSSAHSGLRKPDPEIYRFTLEKLDRLDRGRGGDGIRADQVVFLDDIGANLKAAKNIGFRTIKVNLGKVESAVKELEEATGLKLAGGRSKL